MTKFRIDYVDEEHCACTVEADDRQGAIREFTNRRRHHGT